MKKAIEITNAFHAFEAEGKCLDDCFKATAEKFNITTDHVVDALNKVAFA